jgi:hypothetical protein
MSKVTNLAELRAKRNRVGVTTLDLSDELTVQIAVTDLETLMAQGRIPNPLLSTALNIHKRVQKEGDDLDPKTLIDSLEFMDALCGAVIIDPPWCYIKDAGAGAIPEGHLCLADLTDLERAAVFRLVYGGLEDFETFRAEQRANAEAARDGEGVRGATERLPEAEGVVPELLDRRGSVPNSKGSGVRGGRKGRSGDTADAAVEVASIDRAPVAV